MKKLYISIVVFFLTISIFPQQWQWQNVKPAGVCLYDVVALSSTRVLAFGMAGTELISNDAGETWQINGALNISSDIWGTYFFNASTGFIAGSNGLIMKTTDGGTNWASKNSGTTSNLYDIEFIDVNNGIACGTPGTVFRTTDGGETWVASTPTNASYANYKVSIVNSSTVFLGTGNSAGRLIKSTDFGVSFTNVTPTQVTASVYGMYIADINHYWVVCSAGIIATTDGGTSWNIQQATSSGNTLYDIKFINSTTGFAVDSKGYVWSTTNTGTNWTSTKLVTNKSLRSLSYNSGILYIVGDCGNIYKSIDNGTTWLAKYTSATQEQLRKIIFKDDNNGWTGDAVGSLLQTTDGGQNWSTQYSFGAHIIYSIAMPTSTTWYVSCDQNSLYKTTNAGATFTSLTQPLTGATFWSIGFADSLNGYAGAGSGKLLKTTDGGSTWTDISTAAGMGTGVIYEMAVRSKDTLYIASGSLKKSTNGGTSFTAMAPGVPGNFFTVKFRDANFGVTGAGSLGLSYTSDAGVTWNPCTIPTGPASTASIWSVGFKDPYIWVGSGNGDVIYSSDNGVDWALAPKPTSTAIFGIAVSNNNIWMCGNQGIIIKGHADNSVLPVELTSFRSNLQGQNVILKWATSNEVNSDKFEIQRAIFSSTSANWNTIGFVNATVNSNSTKLYSYIDSKIQAGSYQYRLKLVDMDGKFTYSNVLTADVSKPGSFAMGQNYPNPFNPTTKIDYQVPVDAKILIEVFNIAGQRVAQVVNQEQAAGYYTVDFGSSVKLSSGVYIYRMIAIDKLTGKNFSSIQKMIMMK